MSLSQERMERKGSTKKRTTQKCMVISDRARSLREGVRHALLLLFRRCSVLLHIFPHFQILFIQQFYPLVVNLKTSSLGFENCLGLLRTLSAVAPFLPVGDLSFCPSSQQHPSCLSVLTGQAVSGRRFVLTYLNNKVQ